jgi:hypothetical protein
MILALCRTAPTCKTKDAPSLSGPRCVRTATSATTSQNACGQGDESFADNKTIPVESRLPTDESLGVVAIINGDVNFVNCDVFFVVVDVVDVAVVDIDKEIVDVDAAAGGDVVDVGLMLLVTAAAAAFAAASLLLLCFLLLLLLLLLLSQRGNSKR